MTNLWRLWLCLWCLLAGSLALGCWHRPAAPTPPPPPDPIVDPAPPPSPPPLPEVPVLPLPGLATLQRFRCDFLYAERAGENSPHQSYKWPGKSDADRQVDLDLWQRIGMTHVPINFSLRYQEAEFDFRAQPEVFTERLKELRRARLIPMLNVYAPETYGPQAGLEPLASDLRRLLPMWTDYLGGAFPGFEVGDRGDGSAEMIVGIAKLLRELLGPQKVVGLAFATPGDGHEPVTYDGRVAPNPQHYYRTILGGVVDTLLIEISRQRFEQRDRKAFFDDLAGLNPRFSSRLNPWWQTWPWGDRLSADDERTYRPNWWGPDYGLGLNVIYFEGPGFSRALSAAEKAEWGGWAMTIPGINGYCDGGRVP